MRNSIAKASIVSALVSLIVTLGSTIFFAQSNAYEPGISATELNNLKYSEAVALLESRAHHTQGFAAFLESADSWWFWQNLLVSWAVLASICFICCVLFARWSKHTVEN